MSDKRDRITAAWELRRDIHAWLKLNIGAEMDEIINAFPTFNRDTLRNSVAKLRRDLDVVMIKGKANVGRYSAVSREIVPVSVTRERMAIGGRITQPSANLAWQTAAARRRETRMTEALAKKAAAKAAREAERAAQDDAPLRHNGPRIDPERPWVTIHREGDTAPATDSRGQGAARPVVSVNCFQLF